jgi:hypothetical protein
MVDVLPAEVPPVDLEALLLVTGADAQLLPPDLHAMGGRDSLVERLAAEAPAELGLADAAVAEEDHLHVVLGLDPQGELGKIGAQQWETVDVVVTREKFPRHADRLVGRQPDQVWMFREGPNEPGWDRSTAIDVEASKSLYLR